MSDIDQDTKDALEMLGKGYHPPALIDPGHKQIALSDGLQERESETLVTISPAFREHIRRLKGARLAVWLDIALSMNENGESTLTLKDIEANTGYSPQSVIDAIDSMEQDGYLTVARQPRQINRYTPKFAINGLKSRVLKLESSVPLINNSIDSVININSQQDSKKLTIESDVAGMSPEWAMLAGVSFSPDPELVALADVRARWDGLMGYSLWDGPGWKFFDRFILEQERKGLALERFAEYFKSIGGMKYVGLWSPKGDRAGKNSYQALWPVAFMENPNGQIQRPTEEASASDREAARLVLAQRAQAGM